MKLKKLWKSGEKLAALVRMTIFAAAGIFLSLVMLMEKSVLFPVLIMNIVFWALVAYDLWVVIAETRLEKQINKALAFRGYVATMHNVSTINPASGINYLGFFLGTTQYMWHGVVGKYLLVDVKINKRVTFYIYHIVHSEKRVVAVVDSAVPANKGGVQVFSSDQ